MLLLIIVQLAQKNLERYLVCTVIQSFIWHFLRDVAHALHPSFPWLAHNGLKYYLDLIKKNNSINKDAPSENISPYFVVSLYVLLLPRNMSEITGKIEEFETDVRQRTTICTFVFLINNKFEVRLSF